MSAPVPAVSDVGRLALLALLLAGAAFGLRDASRVEFGSKQLARPVGLAALHVGRDLEEACTR